MSRTQELIRQWTEALNRGDVNAVVDLYAPNARVWDPAYPEPLEGRDAVRRDLEDFLRAFPDLKADLQAAVEGDQLFATEGRFTGTHDGPFVTASGDIPPTGRPMTLAGATFASLDGQGRILEERRYYDLAGLLAQLEVTA